MIKLRKVMIQKVKPSIIKKSYICISDLRVKKENFNFYTVLSSCQFICMNYTEPDDADETIYY